MASERRAWNPGALFSVHPLSVSENLQGQTSTFSLGPLHDVSLFLRSFASILTVTGFFLPLTLRLQRVSDKGKFRQG